jgi:hypothetical protein
MAAPRVWIDATQRAAGRQLWGMSLVERQVREMALRSCRHFHLLVTAETRAAVEVLRGDLHRLYAVEIEVVEIAEEREVFVRLAAECAEIVLLAGDCVYDDRVLTHVLGEGPGAAVCDKERGAFYFSAQQCSILREQSVLSWQQLFVDPGLGFCRVEAATLNAYIASLRLVMPAYIYRLGADEDLRHIDHLMYRRTFKGAIDAVARYGYYHLVRWITRHLASGESTPNLYTLLSVFCVWAASPLIAVGFVGEGLLVAWAGVILDSVDGKLARLRLHLSDSMGAFEHIAAMPGLALWFLATSWHLSDGQLFVWSPLALATWLLLAAFLLDKVTSGLFKKAVGRELFDYRRVDALFHLVAARRNIALLLLSAGALAGYLEHSFYALVLWMAATLAFHLLRFCWVLVNLRFSPSVANS